MQSSKNRQSLPPGDESNWNTSCRLQSDKCSVFRSVKLSSEVTGLCAESTTVVSSLEVDTRTLGRPEAFNGEETKWKH